MPMADRLDDFPDIRALQILDVLLELRGVGACAQRMGLSQPSVSRTLAELRRHFGDPLLMRAPSGLSLTPRAEALRAPLARWLAEGRAMLDPGGESLDRVQRRFRIAATDFGMMAVIGPAMAQLEQVMPRCRLVTEQLDTDSPRRLQDGTLDLMVTGFEPNPARFHHRFLFHDGFACLARRGHPALAEEMTLDRFLAWPHVAVMVAESDSDPLQAFLPKGRDRPAFLETVSFAAAPLIAAQCDSFVILPGRAAQLFVRSQNLAEVTIPLDLGGFDYWLAWHERARRDRTLIALIDILAEAAAGKG